MGEAYLDWQKKSGGIKLNDVIEEYRYVAAGKQIKAGDLVNYINGVAGKEDYGESVDTAIDSTNTNTGYAISAVKLDENRVFVAHSYGTSYYLYGVVVTIDGASITYGTDTQLSNTEGSGVHISATLLTKFSGKDRVFVAHNWGNSTNWYLSGVVVTIDGTTITKGTDKQLVTNNSYSGYVISAVTLPNGNVFIAHGVDNSKRYLYGIVCTISDTTGTTITTGTDTQLSSTTYTAYAISPCLLPNGNVFIAHSYGSNYYLYGIVCTISGTTITKGSDTALVSTNTSGRVISTTLLSNGNIFIAHSYTSYYLYGIVCTVSGTTITKGTDTQLSTLVTSANVYMPVVALENNKVFIAHNNSNSSFYLNGLIASVEDTTITVGVDTQLSSVAYTGYTISSLLLDNGTIFVAHSNNSSYYLNAQIFGLDYENNIPTNNIVIPEYEQQVTPAIEPPFDAVALSSGVGGTDTEHNQQIKIARPNVEVI